MSQRLCSRFPRFPEQDRIVKLRIAVDFDHAKHGAIDMRNDSAYPVWRQCNHPRCLRSRLAMGESLVYMAMDESP